ncbi:hypothetical protein ASC80_05605 [Afipia sp. Root123D2]|uniref:hypothetical protein n=1 Tax=Afipia sp. Root123D2 TaxID=1736436 RepID=UPI0006F23E8D|nr:hypothetical protein [Afipia sp. Root123D2]KQW22816.1 hypothetical protein ASC80_05605 [Afipia sp. Root123D2]
MSEIVDLPPVRLRELADTAEDEAYFFSPGSTRQRLLTMADDMRRCANLAEWLGDNVRASLGS